MIRIQFPTDRERVQGNDLLATQSVVRRLRGQIFEVSEAGLKLLDDSGTEETPVGRAFQPDISAL